jgi:hypothetical protein
MVLLQALFVCIYNIFRDSIMMTVLSVANKKKWRDARCGIDGQVVVWKCVAATLLW